MEYKLRLAGIETALRRYHAGLLSFCLQDLTSVDKTLLLDDLAGIISRAYWPGLLLYSDFMERGDFGVKDIHNFLYSFLKLPRCCDVAAAFYIFWLGVGKENIPASLQQDVIYNNLFGLASNIVASRFNIESLKTLEDSFHNRNPVRKLNPVDSMAIRSVMARVHCGGSWAHLFQLISACVFIALKGIDHKAVYSVDCTLPVISDKKITSVDDLPLFLYFDTEKGHALRHTIGQNERFVLAQAVIVRAWEEYELYKLKKPCTTEAYPHLWYDYWQSTLTPHIEKWDSTYYRLLKSLATKTTASPIKKRFIARKKGSSDE